LPGYRIPQICPLDYGFFSTAAPTQHIFNAEHKKAHHEKQFPLDLEKARQLGKELVQLA